MEKKQDNSSAAKLKQITSLYALFPELVDIRFELESRTA